MERDSEYILAALDRIATTLERIEDGLQRGGAIKPLGQLSRLTATLPAG